MCVCVLVLIYTNTHTHAYLRIRGSGPRTPNVRSPLQVVRSDKAHATSNTEKESRGVANPQLGASMPTARSDFD